MKATNRLLLEVLLITIFALLLITGIVQAQENTLTTGTSGQLSLAAGVQDTIYMAFPKASFITGVFIPSTTAFVMPKAVVWNGNARLEIVEVSGAQPDSEAVLVRPVNLEGRILYSTTPAAGDSVWALGTAFTGAGVNISDGRDYSVSLTGLLAPCPGIAIIRKNLSLSGASSTVRYRLISN